MTIRKKRPQPGKIELDLTGPEGNAFVLLGWAQKTGRMIKEDLMILHGVTPQEVLDEMTSGDYENLVETFDKYFGNYFILYR
jgi:hypothetical protein